MDSSTVDLATLSKKIADAIAAESANCIEINMTDLRTASVSISRNSVYKVINEVIDNEGNYYKISSGWKFYYIDPEVGDYSKSKLNPIYIYNQSERSIKKVCKYNPGSGPFSTSQLQYFTVFVPNFGRNVNDRNMAKREADEKFVKLLNEGKLPKRVEKEEEGDV